MQSKVGGQAFEFALQPASPFTFIAAPAAPASKACYPGNEKPYKTREPTKQENTHQQTPPVPRLNRSPTYASLYGELMLTNVVQSTSCDPPRQLLWPLRPQTKASALLLRLPLLQRHLSRSLRRLPPSSGAKPRGFSRNTVALRVCV
jgi:hypothetical protein